MKTALGIVLVVAAGVAGLLLGHAVFGTGPVNWWPLVGSLAVAAAVAITVAVRRQQEAKSKL